MRTNNNIKVELSNILRMATSLVISADFQAVVPQYSYQDPLENYCDGVFVYSRPVVNIRSDACILRLKDDWRIEVPV